MSRTYRRKNSQWQLNWYLKAHRQETSKYGGTFYSYHQLSPEDNEYKKTVTRYHSDKQLYSNGVPHWYVNLFFERPLRQENKQAIKKWIDNPESELILNKIYKNAGYWWY